MTTTVHKFQEKGSPPPKKPRKTILLEELPDNTNIQLAKNEKGLFVDESGFIPSVPEKLSLEVVPSSG